MSLSTRLTLLLTAVLAIGALVGDRLHRRTFANHFASIERIGAEEAARNVAHAIAHEARELERDATQVAWSDGLYAALGRPNAPLLQEIAPAPVLAASGLDLVIITDLEGRVRFHHLRHPDDPGLAALRQFPDGQLNLIQLFGRALDVDGARTRRTTLASGLVATERGPLVLVASNVVPTAGDSARAGFALIGRFLGSELETALEERLGFAVDVWPVGSSSMPPEALAQQDLATASPEPIVVTVDSRRLDVYTTVEDLRRRPEFLVRAALRRPVAEAATMAMGSALLLSLTVSLGVLLTLVIALRAQVIRPILRLTRAAVQVGEREDYSLRVAEPRSDEVGRLGAEFDRMLVRLEEARGQVIETARAAGMSEIAMGILHNVGNVLNSVNISTSMLSERVAGMCVDDLSQLADVLRQKSDDLARFVTEDPQGKNMQPFLSALVRQLGEDRKLIAREVEALSAGIEHVCELVKSQQGLTRKVAVTERVSIERLVHDAVRLTSGARTSDALPVRVELEPDMPPLIIDRNKALEVLVNLVQNARQAMDEAGPQSAGQELLVRAQRSFGGKVRIDVVDAGVGIAAEDLTRIFQLGFTTKVKGSGLGLHSAANSARVLGGSVTAESQGRGHGARFILELPFGAQSDREAA